MQSQADPSLVLSSVVQLTSPNQSNNRFGTGFVVYRDYGKSYIVTCAHVANDVAHDGQVTVDGLPGRIVALGDENALDLAVIGVDALVGDAQLELNKDVVNEGDAVVTAGFHGYGRKLSLIEIRGRIGKLSPLTYRGRADRINAWRLVIDDDHLLQQGFSGAPVISTSTGKVIAVVSDREGEGKKGLAIALTSLHVIWPQIAVLDRVRKVQVTSQVVYPYLHYDVEGLCQFLVTIRADKIVDVSSTIPAHICLVLDLSGSMNTPSKYPLLLDAMPLLLEALDDSDYITIIGFSDRTELLLSQSVSEFHQSGRRVENIVDQSSIKFGGATLLAPAIGLATEHIRTLSHAGPPTVHRIYLLTDGELHDGDACVALNARLKNSGAEVHSYGFGSDFANVGLIDAIRAGCPGVTTKAIFNTANVRDTFSHIGQLTKKIASRQARLECAFLDSVQPGDAFRYRPSEHFPPSSFDGHTFHYSIGSLERGRVYRFFFEARVFATKPGNQHVATIKLEMEIDGVTHTITEPVVVTRTDNTDLLRTTNLEAAEAHSVLKALQIDDKRSLLEALRVRERLYIMEGRDPELITRISAAIKSLEKGEELTGVQRRDLRTATATKIVLTERPQIVESTEAFHVLTDEQYED